MTKVKDTKNKKIEENNVEDTEEVMSLLDRIKQEKKTVKTSNGNQRTVCREAFKLWLSIPKTFLGMPEAVTDKMGIEDSDVIELLEVKTQTEFSEKYFITQKYLSEWKKEILADDQTGLEDVKKFFKKLSKNVFGSLYKQILAEGDAPRVKLFLQSVHDWSEQTGIRLSGEVETTLSKEDKAQLDRLLKLNTK